MRISPDDCAREVLEVVPLIMRAIRTDMRSHRTPDLSVPQFRTLAFIDRNAGASLSDAADYIGLTLPSMSKIVDGLVARRLVIRQTHRADRRRMTLALTARGQARLQSAREAAQACLASSLASLSDIERAAIAEAMQAMRPIFTPRQEAGIRMAR